MIDVWFQFGGEVILIKIDGNKILFGNTLYGARLANVEGLKLDYRGVCREFPDLETAYDWREQAIDRFKEKVKSLKTEKAKADYIINDLKKHGYIPKRMQVRGGRIQKL